MNSDDFAHLLPDVRVAAALPDEERIDLIRVAEWWIGYARAQEVLARLHELFVYGPGRLRPPDALLVAPSNNGKSTLVERFRRDHGPPPGAGDGFEAEVIPVVVLQMPTEPSVSRFYATLLDELGAPPVAPAGARASTSWSGSPSMCCAA
jgi:hypothetical protein